MTPLECADLYCRRGWSVVPIPSGEKGPKLPGWGKLRLKLEDLPQPFGSKSNIGVILGPASGELVDFDLDCKEALALADLYLPRTDAIFGRKSKPRSHRLYVAPGAVHEVFADPLDGTTLLELRGQGRDGGCHQTVFPGSVHPSGEPITWESPIIAPRALKAAALRLAAVWLAIGCLVMRHVSEYTARRPSRDMPKLLWEADRQLGMRAYRWLGLPNPDMPRLRPKPRQQLTENEIDLAEMVAAIPNDGCCWDDWVAVGLATFASSGGSGEGAIIFDNWSAKSHKYNPHITAAKWQDFHKYPPNNTGVGKLIRMAIAAGWRSRKERV